MSVYSCHFQYSHSQGALYKNKQELLFAEGPGGGGQYDFDLQPSTSLWVHKVAAAGRSWASQSQRSPDKYTRYLFF